MSVRARGLFTAVCLAVLLPVVPTATAIAAEKVTIRDVDATGFPTIRIVVSTRQAIVLAPRDVGIIENGLHVAAGDVHPLGAEGHGVDAVLAIDVSNSMRGRQLSTALAAAQTFLDGVPSTMPLGVLAFSQEPVVLAPVSADRLSVSTAVASIGGSTSQGTAIFDTVATASEMFDPESGAQHNLILVTDGRNTGGEHDLAEAVAAAQAAGVHVFTVGLFGPETDEETLRALAADTGGEYAAISPTELEAVYTGFAEKFTQQYVVEYRSKAPLGATVRIDLHLPIGSASIGFVAPGYDAVHKRIRTKETISFWAQPTGMSLVVGLTFASALVIGLVVANANARRRRERQLRSSLVTHLDATWEDERKARATAASLVPRQLADAAERVAGRTGAGQQLARRLEHAGWAVRSGEFVWIVGGVAIILGSAGFALAGPVTALVGIGLGTMIPFTLVSRAASRRQAAIQAQLADTLMVIASSMRAGHSFMQSLDSAAKEVDEPASGEFGRVLTEIRLGRDTEAALEALVERVGSQDLEWAVTAIKIQRKIGGNLAEVLETVAKTIRERETLRRQVRVLSAEARISIVVLTVLPILLAAYIMIVNPEYLRVLSATKPGVVISISGGVLMGIGYVWMRKIVRLDV